MRSFTDLIVRILERADAYMYYREVRGGVPMKKLEEYVRSIPDFPEEGIIFRDVTTVIQDPEGLHLAIDEMKKRIKDLDFDLVVGSESRGFVFGVPIAYSLGKGFIMARKPGKLPFDTISESYELEYGEASLEMHKDSIKPGQKVVIVDDLIATGGTAKAVINLVERMGGEVVSLLFLIELAGLGGRGVLSGYRVDSAIIYEGK